jgi:hypothetical protein
MNTTASVAKDQLGIAQRDHSRFGSAAGARRLGQILLLAQPVLLVLNIGANINERKLK